MAGFVAGDPSHCAMVKSGSCNNSQYKMEEPDNLGSGWYFSRKEIEENSPSRRDGIDLKKEAYHRKTYCTLLQDLGMRLKVPQVTIATAIVFCHRFFLRQSHAKNDKRTIATVCMFLAGKVEETPRPLKDVIIVSYEIIHKKDPSAIQKIKQKEVYEQQKELILLGERVVLTTLGFDLNVHHPYKPLVEAIKKFKVARNALAQVAWNFVNDGLRTSLCLQFKPHHIAAGAIFLAAKFLKVKLPSDGDTVWWQEFDVNPRQLEDVSNQMLELYEQNRATQSSHPNEVEGSTGGGTNQLAMATSTVNETSVAHPSYDITVVNVKNEAQVAPPPKAVPAQLNANSNRTVPNSTQNKSDDTGSADTRSGVWDHNNDGEGNANSHRSSGQNPSSKEYNGSLLERPVKDGVNVKGRLLDARDWMDEASLPKTGKNCGEDSRYSDVVMKIDKGKVKAALEKRRKLRTDMSKKTDIIDEDDLIERELENGIEMAVDDDKTKPVPLTSHHQTSRGKINSKTFDHGPEENIEEGELSSLEEHELPSPKLQKNKGASWSDTERDRKKPRREICG